MECYVYFALLFGWIWRLEVSIIRVSDEMICYVN
jgi:hypothetical protein